MAVVSALPQRLDIVVISGDAFSFSFSLNQNITGVTLTASLYYYEWYIASDMQTAYRIAAAPRTLSHSVSNAATGLMSVSLTTADTVAAWLRGNGDSGCLAYWVLKSATKTYAAGTVTAGEISGCSSVSTFTSEDVFL